MPISSLLLEVEEGGEAELMERLREVPGVEVHEAVNRHMVVVTDTGSAGEDRKLADYIGSLHGIRSANVVYTNMEDIIMEDTSVNQSTIEENTTGAES